MVVPKILKNFNLMVDGVNYAGKCEEVTPPALTIKEDEWRGGGMDAPIGIDMGMEKIQVKFSMQEHSPELFKQFGLLPMSGVSVLFRAAAADDKTVDAYVIEATGKFQAMISAAVKAGGKPALEGTITCTYYKLTIAGQLLIEIDILNCKRIIGGTDQMVQMRQALGI